MAIYPDDVNAAKKYLWDEETVQVTATQRKVGPGGAVINPTTIVATDKRVLIINRETLGVRKDVESIPYNRIASVRYEKGIISSSVFIVVAGYVSPAGEQGFLKPGESEGEIGGLHGPDAKSLADFIGKMVAGILPENMQQQGQGMPGKSQQAGGPSGAYVYCSSCGTRNIIGAKFCSNCGKPLGK